MLTALKRYFLTLLTAMPRSVKQAIIVMIDVATLPLALLVGLSLQQNAFPAPVGLFHNYQAVALLMMMSGVLSIAIGIHKVQLKAYETRALGMTGAHVLTIAVAVAVLDGMTGGQSPAATAVIFAFVYFSSAAGFRILLLKFLYSIYATEGTSVRVLIYGAGTTGKQLVAALRTDSSIHPVAFVDDNPNIQSTLVQGLRVFSPLAIPTIVRERGIDRVLLAMPSQSRAHLAQITARLEDVGLSVETVPSFAQLAGSGAPIAQQLRPVSARQFLGRAPLDAELPGGAEIYAGESVLITGAGGSIGSELCRQILSCKPRRLILLEIGELPLYRMSQELRAIAAHHGVELVPALGSVCEAPIVRRILREHEVSVVLHAAAYKHVPIVERDPVPGFANNVLGTQVLAAAAAEAGVARFIYISTDKAVRPKNLMGASKRLAETIIQDFASRSNPAAGGTIFSMVRFGNVIGSSGSVIPLFQEQIAKGGPVTLTHRDVSRYFMTIPEAARLVLVSGTFATGGDVFVLDMGDPVPIYNLARQMIEATGHSVRDEETRDGDIEIVLTGLRPGEKLHEELLIGEGQTTTPHPKILQAREAHLSEIEVAACLKALRQAIADADDAAIRAIVARWVERQQVVPPAEATGPAPTA